MKEGLYERSSTGYYRRIESEKQSSEGRHNGSDNKKHAVLFFHADSCFLL